MDFSGTGRYIKVANTASNITFSGNAARFEGEDAAVAVLNAPDQRIISFPGLSGGDATIVDSNAIGQYVTYLVPAVSAGTYQISIGAKTDPGRGIWQLAIGTAAAFSGTAHNLGSAVDEYMATNTVVSYSLGSWVPSSTSDKWFQFMITGKNAASTGYTASFDYIQLGQ